jgi:general secretion pathway protein A
MESLNSRASRNSSIEAILKLWFPGSGIEMEKGRIEDELPFFRAAAWQYGLQALPLATESDLGIIERLNLPAVFTFYLPRHAWPRYLAITGIDEKNVYYVAAGQEEPVPLKREILLQHWSGEAYIFWKNFRQLYGVVNLESMGKSVTTLKGLLQQEGHTIVDQTESYDKDTRDIIRGLQAKYDLLVDGVVGPFTKIVLYNESSQFKTPSLGRQRETATENGS